MSEAEWLTRKKSNDTRLRARHSAGQTSRCETARRLLLAALCWAVGAGWPGTFNSQAEEDAPAFGDITFFIGSDLHYGYNLHAPTCDEISRGTLNRMNLLPGQAYPAAVGGGLVAAARGVLLIGDLTDLGGSAQWTDFTNNWGLNGERLLSFPVYEGYGNHDTLGSRPANSIKARNPSRTGVTNISTNGYHYSWDWDFLHLVCLNVFPGNEPGPNLLGGNPRNSLQFLAEDLAQRVGDSGRPVVLYHHFGFDSESLTWWTEQQRTNYYETIKNYNVIAIFAGHNHAANFIPWRGFDTFNDGTVGKFTGNFLVAHVTRTNLVVVERTAASTWGDSFNKNISVFNPDADNDGDGMPSGWESQHGLDPFDPADARQDADGDGQTNLAEYVAGTDPRNANDLFRVAQIRRAITGPGIEVDVPAHGGRVYTLERSVNLTGQNWSVVATSGVVPNDGNVTLVDPSPPSDGALYRVMVQLP
jgi:hypothetical protein